MVALDADRIVNRIKHLCANLDVGSIPNTFEGWAKKEFMIPRCIGERSGT